MAYDTVPLQQLLREIANKMVDEQDADAIRLAADTLDAIASRRTLTTDDVRAAFWKTFHKCGEVWFNYLGTDEENEHATQAFWDELLENLSPPTDGK